MMKKGCLLLCATAISLACVYNQAQASINFNLKAPPVPSYAKLHTSHTSHLIARHLSSPLLIENAASVQEIKVAQVCWITDTDNCGGADFVGTDREQEIPDILPPGDGDSCIKMGYKKTDCPQGYKPNKYCPLDSSYFAECIPDCPSDYVTCEAPLKGVGEVCGNGLYQDCCTPICPAEYKYTLGSIPDGYEADGEPCRECDEGGFKIKEKYKIKEKDCSGFIDCGNLGCKDGTPTCQTGDKILCSECTPCPNLGTESECPKCSVCSYEECSGLYIVVGCATGCTDWCNFPSPSPNCTSLGYTESKCSDGALKCPFDINKLFCF